MRVVLSWLVGLFRCPGCVELRSERDYLRSILASTRSMTRDVMSVPYVQPAISAEQPLTIPNDVPEPIRSFRREPVMDRDDLPEMPS